MIETLSIRAQRLATQTSTKRLFYLCSLLGLISLVGVCVVVLPWNVLYTRGQWVAFSFLALIAFCWLGSVAAMGRLELDLPRTVKAMAWLLTVSSIPFTIVRPCTDLEVRCSSLPSDKLPSGSSSSITSLRTELLRYITGAQVPAFGSRSPGHRLDDPAKIHSLQLDSTLTPAYCEHRLEAIIIAFPIIVFLLPVLSVPLLYLLFRQSRLLSTSHLYSNLGGDTSSDLPPNWDVRPETFAPDSSASDDDVDERYDRQHERKQVQLHGRGTSPGLRSQGPDEAGRAWFELGKHQRDDSSAGTKGRRWSEVRRGRDRKSQGRAQ
ncbi:hypothetical protein JCM11491_006656 [Sporobolomyces phaffii]